VDLNEILTAMRREHAQLTEAIVAIERMGAEAKRRGRPPAWLAAVKQRPAKRRGRPPGSKNRPKAE